MATEDTITIDNKYRFSFNASDPVSGKPSGIFMVRRFDEKPREIWDKAVLSLFFHALELKTCVDELEGKVKELETKILNIEADSYKSDDLPDLVGSSEINLEDTDIVG